MPEPELQERGQAERERSELLTRVGRALEGPMAALGLLWLVLVGIELTLGLSPFLDRLTYFIWGLFALHFAFEFALAPRKLRYLRDNWLTALSLLAPAFRLVRALRALMALRAAGGLRLLRVVSALNRSTRALGRVMGRRGAGYVGALTLLVTAGGAAGMYAFERAVPGTALESYGSALWWTAMVITTMGSDYSPQTPEGRLLCLLLAIYGFAVFGYVTATIASVFVARDAEEGEGSAQVAAQLAAITGELAALRADVGTLRPPPPAA